MGIKLRKFAELGAIEISSLRSRLTEYYASPPPAYYAIADRAAAQYAPEIQPFHVDLVGRIKPGMSILEVGCGSAHLCPHVERAGGSYTGIDHSHELLEGNRKRFPRARFFSIDTTLSEQFDLVTSLYTIEHVVDPPAYLETMWSYCKPAGFLAVICPNFIDSGEIPPSCFYGKTPRRFREKIRSLAVSDAIAHLIDMFWIAPRWKSQAHAPAPGAFWINLEPRIFHGAEYTIDADAVHLPRLRDIVWWLERHGASIVETSISMKDAPSLVLRYNCYVLARKPSVM
jgi:2-polyprenyl-3-methyl-5-hydroxy-6-metoxy-1,4-benzoquinol methylase